MGNEKFAAGLIIGIALCLMGCLVYWGQLGTTTGITVTHNGKPVDNLNVKVYCANGNNVIGNWDTDIQGGTTDGTGSYTWNMDNINGCNGYNLAYTFEYNGTSMVFTGPNQGTVNVQV